MGAADNGAMHLLVPFASALSEAGRHTLRDLALPHLDRALARNSSPAMRDELLTMANGR